MPAAVCVSNWTFRSEYANILISNSRLPRSRRAVLHFYCKKNKFYSIIVGQIAV